MVHGPSTRTMEAAQLTVVQLVGREHRHGHREPRRQHPTASVWDPRRRHMAAAVAAAPATTIHGPQDPRPLPMACQHPLQALPATIHGVTRRVLMSHRITTMHRRQEQALELPHRVPIPHQHQPRSARQHREQAIRVVGVLTQLRRLRLLHPLPLRVASHPEAITAPQHQRHMRPQQKHQQRPGQDILTTIEGFDPSSLARVRR
jgi:hypothetical protein